jgi:hypothetical protein
MPDNIERRENCLYHQELTKDLKSAVFGNGKPGIKYELETVKTKLNISLSLQVAMFLTIIGSLLKSLMEK